MSALIQEMVDRRKQQDAAKLQRYLELLALDGCDAKAVAELDRLAQVLGKSADAVASDHRLIQDGLAERQRVADGRQATKDMQTAWEALTRFTEEEQRRRTAADDKHRQLRSEHDRLSGIVWAGHEAQKRIDQLLEQNPTFKSVVPRTWNGTSIVLT